MRGTLQNPSKLADVLDNLREGVQVIGPDWRYVYLNSAAAAQARQPLDALVGRTMMECYPGIENTEAFRMLARVADTGKPESMTSEFTFPDGWTGWFELRAQRVPAGIVVLSIDVTNQRAMEANLRQAMRLEALGRLAGSVAHDFNNILTVIGGCTALLAATVSEERTARDLKQIDGAVARAARITGQLLAFARNKPVAPIAIDPWGVTTGLLSMSKLTLGVGIVVERRRGGQVSRVRMDPGALEQVILNLLLNARDAMNGNGRVIVEASEIEIQPGGEMYERLSLPSGRYVVLSVTDTGWGIAPEHREHIFDPFFSTKGETGTGLGLSSSQGLVAQAGGTIVVESEPGHGATFRVYLPAVDLRPPPSPRTQDRRTGASPARAEAPSEPYATPGPMTREQLM